MIPQRSNLRTLFASLLAAVLLTLMPSPAHALTGRGYDNTDPSKSYDGKPACNQNASRIKTYPFKDDFSGATVPNATLEVYYSSSCGTNWLRVVNNNALYGGSIYQEIKSTAGGRETERDFGSVGSYYSMQVYAPGTTRIDFRAILSNEGRSAHVGWTHL